MCNALYPSPCFYKADSPFQLMLLANNYGNKNVAGIVERKNNCFIAQRYLNRSVNDKLCSVEQKS